jgi:hypothetical protein
VAARTDRLNAAKRIDLAQRSSDPEVKLALLDMAQYWLTPAEQSGLARELRQRRRP